MSLKPNLDSSIPNQSAKLPSIEVMLNDLATRELADTTFLKGLAAALNSIGNDFSKIEDNDLLRTIVNKAMEIGDRLKGTLSSTDAELIKKFADELGRREVDGQDIEAFRNSFQRISQEVDTINNAYSTLKQDFDDFSNIQREEGDFNDYALSTRNEQLSATKLAISTFQGSFETELRYVTDEVEKITNELKKEKPDMEQIRSILAGSRYYLLAGMISEVDVIGSNLNQILGDYSFQRQTSDLAEVIKNQLLNFNTAINTFDSLMRIL